MIPQYVDIKTQNGVTRISAVSPKLFRVQVSESGVFTDGALIRYGILKNDWPTVNIANKSDKDGTVIATDAASLIIRLDGSWIFSGKDNLVLESAAAPMCSDSSGFDAAITLSNNEKIYGLGDVTRDRVEKRGFRTAMWVRNVASYVPIPYVMSSRGWGLFINTTFRHFVDVGHTDKKSLRFWGKNGGLDFYLFCGDNLPDLLNVYTDLAGKPRLLPMWAYGLTFVCNQQANAREMIDDCLSLRREGIPCDVIGLEPGWMSKNYDYSTEKDWHPERFYIPSWVRKPGDVSGGNDQTFMGAARRLGFKVSLWLCADYDLSFEEERQANGKKVSSEEKKIESRHEDDFEQDVHFGHGPTMMDKLTKPAEPWFEHLKKFVDDGASAFKMDGALQVNEHPDRKWGNGMDDEEMHNLYPALLNKQMHEGFRRHTHRRSMTYSSGGYAGIQQWSATWAGDTGGGPKPLISMINHGLSGHVNTSCDMDVFTPAGIHFGFLQPWSQVCSWAYWRHPWLLGDKLLPIFKAYANLRYELLPYIYSTAHQAWRTGLPILRGMSLAFPKDPQSDELVHQYMLGDAFLVAAFTNDIHLPEGRWVDYWTRKEYAGPLDLSYEIPEDRGGALFVRAGSIVPRYPVMDYVGQKKIDTVTLDVFTLGAPGTSTFELSEDDGVSYDYEKNHVAVTHFLLEENGNGLTLTIPVREGGFEEMPDERHYRVVFRGVAKPGSVWANGRELSEGSLGYSHDRYAREVSVLVSEDAAKKKPLVLSLKK